MLQLFFLSTFEIFSEYDENDSRYLFSAEVTVGRPNVVNTFNYLLYINKYLEIHRYR